MSILQELYDPDAVLVQKYGGTSMGNKERILAIAARAKRFKDRGHKKFVIVVSAMAGETNRLLSMIRDINPSVEDQFSDLAAAAGEQVAVALLSAALQKEGIKAEPLLAFQLGIFTDAIFSRAKIKSINTQAIENAWKENKIPVIAGFQGVTDNLQLTTIGRGGSDTSAVAIAAALKADCCEINTDVNGVYQADPRLIPSAGLCENLDFEVALEMASLGSKVLHPRCVELAAKFEIPLVVRNTFTPDDSERTVIMKHTEQMEAPVVSGLTLDKNVCRIVVKFQNSEKVPIADFFERIAEHGVNVDVIIFDHSQAGRLHEVGFTVSNEDLNASLKAIEAMKSNPSSGIKIESFNYEKSLAKISLVGLGMRTHLGVASKMFKAFEDQGIGIRMISTSEIKISCILAENQSEAAYQSTYKSFFT